MFTGTISRMLLQCPGLIRLTDPIYVLRPGHAGQCMQLFRDPRENLFDGIVCQSLCILFCYDIIMSMNYGIVNMPKYDLRLVALS